MQIEANSFYLDKLSEIADGECFLAQFNKGKLMMKLYSTKACIEGEGYRAVELETGAIFVELQDCDIIPVNAKVVIGD